MRREQARLQSAIHEALFWGRRALRHLGDATPLAFSEDEKTVDAVTRCVEVVGEAAVRAIAAQPDIVKSNAELFLREARDARNAAIHEYEKIEADNMFVTIEEVIRPLVTGCEAFLGARAGEAETPDDPDGQP
ncbi:HepT-like ribonuclease domain-containing protein [Aurantimonas sp. 22II-16-19i]|uniref:HepT-like ribonuclease domain-containing protein n=1 Tax=Aurantimonas sp. 22II-16-19i TaxID=1317114 RepID=UPI0009F7D6FA|nr:HepT-like ribonuclease domain-containing protein [Aurantimonas sp. 22II-16-19i]ORE97769.1 hypothetical protein ATO4_07515 [Aurantimonas sp. 22II-16-19i]